MDNETQPVGKKYAVVYYKYDEMQEPFQMFAFSPKDLIEDFLNEIGEANDFTISLLKAYSDEDIYGLIEFVNNMSPCEIIMIYEVNNVYYNAFHYQRKAQ